MEIVSAIFSDLLSAIIALNEHLKYRYAFADLGTMNRITPVLTMRYQLSMIGTKVDQHRWVKLLIFEHPVREPQPWLT